MLRNVCDVRHEHVCINPCPTWPSGYFLPVDPSNSWLDRVSNDPQPSGWKDAMRKALGEVPRFDGF